MEFFGKIVSGILLLMANTILRGFVLCQLWAWFVVDTFSLPQLRVIEALGVSLIVSFLTISGTTNKSDRSFNESMFIAFGVTGTGWVFGWIYSFFM
ncbi:MAG: hypothetical protein ACRBCS_02935 [Cellvibrionaceae bacterium]